MAESIELPRFEQGGIAGELQKGAEALLRSVERGEDVRPNIESITNWLEDRAHEGVEKLHEVLSWVDSVLETSLSEVAVEVRAFVIEAFATIRDAIGQGLEFIETHPEVFRALAALLAVVISPELASTAMPLLRQATASF